MLKKIIVFSYLIVGMLCHLSYPLLAQQAYRAPISTGRYLDRDAGFSLKPSGWAGQKIDQGDTALKLYSPDKTALLTVMVISNPNNLNSKQLESALYQQASAAGYQILKSHQIQIGRYLAGEVIYQSPQGSIEQTIALPIGGRIYVLQAAARNISAFRLHSNTIQAIAYSFQPELTRSALKRLQRIRYYERREFRRRERLRRERLRRERLERERRERERYNRY